MNVSGAEIDFASLAELQEITVLHVEDDPAFADLTATFLERENDAIDVVSETSAEAALERLPSEGSASVDCIVSDYQMPEMDGLELLEVVRERFPDLPFILFTGEGSEAVAGRAISAGVTDYLQKESGTDQYAVLANRIENSVERATAVRNGEQLLGAIETAREGISLLDEEGRFIYVNRAYADTYGYDREELLGEHWEILYPAEAVDRVQEEILPAVPENDALREETRMIDADGEELVVDHTLSYTPGGVMVCNVDQPLDGEGQHGLFADVLDAMDDLVFFFGTDGTLQYWNDRVEEVTGYTGDELSGLTPAAFVHQGDRDRIREYVQKTAETGDARVEAQLRLADGGTAPYEFISKPVTSDAGNVIGRVGLGRDVSDRKQYEQRIERQNERLEHFAEVLSHDLRNPLAVAEGHLQEFARTGSEEYYETTERALERMRHLITDVLELARDGELIRSGDYETVDLAGIATDAWAMIRHEEATLEVADSWAVRADASRLQQLLENLFRNAIEHGGEDVTARIGLLADGEGFYVEDDGPGIPEAERDAVFEAGHTTKVGGTGYGLTTVDQLVVAHDWDLRITDGGLGGARFEIRGVAFPDRS